MILHILKYELKFNKAPILWISTILFLFQMIYVAFFASIRPDETMSPLYDKLPKFIRVLLGEANIDILTVNGFLSFGFTHPLVLFLVWIGTVSFTSRFAVHSGGMGLTDMVNTQPVHRVFHLLLRVASGEISGLCFVLAIYAGQTSGTCLFTLPAEVDRLSFIYVVINLYAYFLAILGLGTFIAVLSRNRSKAVGITFGVLMVMFLLNIFRELWPLFEVPATLSLLAYYIPGKVVVSKTFPLENVLILVSFYTVSVTAACVIFNRRDL